MVSTCLTCSVQGPPLLPLSDEHRQLLHAIVSPVVNMMELTAYPLHICATCKLWMEEVHKFQQTAQRGVKAFKSLLSVLEIRPAVVQATFFKPMVEAKPDPITIKTDPENDLSTVELQFNSVLASSYNNPLSEEIHLKFEPESTTEAGFGSNVSRNQERIPDLISNPDPFMAQSGSVGSNGSSFTGMQNMINNVVPYVQSNPGVVHSNQPNQISTQMRKTVAKENSVNSIQVAKFAKNGENLSSIRIRNPTDLQQNVSSIWHVAEKAAKVDSNDGNFEVFTHEGRKNPEILSQNSEQLVRKVYKKIRKKPEDMKCTYCGKIFKGKESLNVHIKRIHLGLNCHYSCEKCEKSFRTDVGLKLHIKNKHEQPKETTIDDVNLEWFCMECSVQFATRQKYKAHLTTLKHTPREQYAFVCETCEKRFATEKKMQNHIDVVHLNKKNFKCEICGKTFCKKSGMLKHVQTVHEKQAKERPHVCHLCGKSFTAPKTLQDHLHAHQGLRPYECKLCSATFSYKAALYTHNRLKHLKIKTKKEAKINADAEKERKRKRKVKKAADKAKGVENEAVGTKERNIEKEVGVDDASGVEKFEKTQIELEIIRQDADSLSINS